MACREAYNLSRALVLASKLTESQALLLLARGCIKASVQASVTKPEAYRVTGTLTPALSLLYQAYRLMS